MIRNSSDLKYKYILLNFANKLLREKDNQYLDMDNLNNYIVKSKKEIREYYKKENEKRFERIVKDNGIDGYIILFELPKEITSLESAEEYFKCHEYRECRPSMYDCTGQAFTSWYKIFKRNNKFYAYHSISFDV